MYTHRMVHISNVNSVTLSGSCDFSTSARMARQASSISTSPVKNSSTSPGLSHLRVTGQSKEEGKRGD